MRSAALAALAFAAAALAGCSGGGDGETGADLAPGQAVLRGVVVTATIVPIPNATVSVEPGGFEAATGADGQFALGPLDLGAYRLEASAPGYATQRLEVQVEPGQERMVSVVLDATATDVPYHELLHFEAFIECSYAQSVGPLGGDFSCFGLSDLVLGVKVDNDVNDFPLHVNAGGFKGLLFEMAWEPQASMPGFAGFIRDPAGVGELGGLGAAAGDRQYWVGSGESPLVAWVLQGVENDGAYEGDVFHPDPAKEGEYEILVGGSSQDDPEVAVALNQRLDLFVTLFYNALGDVSYSALAPPA